ESIATPTRPPHATDVDVFVSASAPAKIHFQKLGRTVMEEKFEPWRPEFDFDKFRKDILAAITGARGKK
ncbi:MAG: hypothetical protein Q8P02_03360, partial [Candidatus Micrarchaeota archaeon]|nr:hypothetical protein [Candidatus Micrarchaeota archaeon]